MQSPISILIKLRRSTDKLCWDCSRYPNCDMCERRHSLRHVPKKHKLPTNIQSLVSKVCRYADADLTLKPSALQISGSDAQKLTNFGICILVKKSEHPGNYIYKLNTDNHYVMKWLKRYAKIRKKKNQKIP